MAGLLTHPMPKKQWSARGPFGVFPKACLCLSKEFCATQTLRQLALPLLTSFPSSTPFFIRARLSVPMLVYAHARPPECRRFQRGAAGPAPSSGAHPKSSPGTFLPPAWHS